MSQVIQRLRIEGETVIHEEVKEFKRVALKDLQKEMGRYGNGLVPQGCVYYAHTAKHNLYMIEEKSQIRKIDVKFSSASSSINIDASFELRFPTTVFLMLFKGSALVNTWMHLLNTPHFDRDDQMLYHTPLFNLWGDNKVCMGRGLSINTERGLSGKIDSILEHFWGSVFNTDITEQFYRHMPPEISNFEYLPDTRVPNDDFHKLFLKWAQMSQDESIDFNGLHWHPVEPTKARVSAIVGVNL